MMKIDPWVSHPHIWKTKAKFFEFLRGGIRRGIWERSPAKLDFKDKTMSPPPTGYTGRGKSGTKCALSGTWYSKSKMEVDHIKGNVPLKDWDDVLPFIQHLTQVEGNMQMVGTEEHKIKSYAEREGMTYEQAVIEKKVISFTKGSVAPVKLDMVIRGASDSDMANAKSRKAFYRKLVESGQL